MVKPPANKPYFAQFLVSERIYSISILKTLKAISQIENCFVLDNKKISNINIGCTEGPAGC